MRVGIQIILLTVWRVFAGVITETHLTSVNEKSRQRWLWYSFMCGCNNSPRQ